MLVKKFFRKDSATTLVSDSIQKYSQADNSNLLTNSRVAKSSYVSLKKKPTINITKFTHELFPSAKYLSISPNDYMKLPKYNQKEFLKKIDDALQESNQTYFTSGQIANTFKVQQSSVENLLNKSNKFIHLAVSIDDEIVYMRNNFRNKLLNYAINVKAL